MSLYDDPRVVYWLRDPLWGALYHAIYHGARLLPCRAASALGAQIGAAEGRYRYAETTRRAEGCLAAIRPDLAPGERAATVQAMWRNVGRVHCEMPVVDRLWSAAEVTQRNEEALRRVARSGRPVVFVFAHLGNWELLAVALQRAGFKLNVVYEELRNRFERGLANRSRRRLGYRLVAPTRRGTRELFAALGRGESVALALDEYKDGNVRSPALGRALPADANLHYALRLARRFGAAVVPLYCVRTAPLAFTLHFHDAMANPDADALNALCESWILAHPEQWYMLWRLLPEGLPRSA